MNTFVQAQALRALNGLEDSGWARTSLYWANRIAHNAWEYGVQQQTARRLGALKISDSEWLTFKQYCARYASFCEHMKETRHCWTLDKNSLIHYADNSITAEQVSRLTDERRTVTLASPSGDLCF